jgi:hypothetical protein
MSFQPRADISVGASASRPRSWLDLILDPGCGFAKTRHRLAGSIPCQTQNPADCSGPQRRWRDVGEAPAVIVHGAHSDPPSAIRRCTAMPSAPATARAAAPSKIVSRDSGGMIGGAVFCRERLSDRVVSSPKVCAAFISSDDVSRAFCRRSPPFLGVLGGSGRHFSRFRSGQLPYLHRLILC